MFCRLRILNLFCGALQLQQKKVFTFEQLWRAQYQLLSPNLIKLNLSWSAKMHPIQQRVEALRIVNFNINDPENIVNLKPSSITEAT
jgi:hypothetical protein